MLNHAVLGVLLVLLAGCGKYSRQGLDKARAGQIEQAISRTGTGLSREQEDRILALDPLQVSDQDVRVILSNAPAPRIVSIHGGNSTVVLRMISFADFLMGMGYPGQSLTNSGDGTYTFSCYESSKMIAGTTAWFYEKEALRPMLVGHSQGGIQVVKVLYFFAGKTPLHVWNPLTWKQEKRRTIRDPLTGKTRPVTGLILPYATAVGAGGLTRLLPNQWDMTFTLRTIPNSVEEFTGFCKENDLLGGDWLGYGSANEFKSGGTAVVRNVWLPTDYAHGAIPDTRHLLESAEMRQWINAYVPSNAPVVELTLAESFEGDSRHILWAADVWYSIKKHWVLELQRLIRAQREPGHGN